MSKKLLIATLGVQTKSRATESMVSFAATHARRAGAKVVCKDGNLYATKGEADIYPCIVAHTDTVHDFVGDFRVWEDKKYGDLFAWDHAKNVQAGIGGDDKVGVYIALALLRSEPVLKIALFKDEEIGCQGARAADMEFFNDVAFVLEADRRGYEDVVIEASGVELCSDEFAARIMEIGKKYGRKKTRYGLMTDVLELKEKKLPVSCINVSCGYYQPHTKKEYVVTAEVMRTKYYFRHIIKEMGGQKWPHEYTPRTYSRMYGGTYHTFSPRNGKTYDRIDGYWEEIWGDEWYDGTWRDYDDMPAAGGKYLARESDSEILALPLGGEISAIDTKKYGVARYDHYIGEMVYVFDDIEQVEAGSCSECGFDGGMGVTENELGGHEVFCAFCLSYPRVLIGDQRFYGDVISHVNADPEDLEAMAALYEEGLEGGR